MTFEKRTSKTWEARLSLITYTITRMIDGRFSTSLSLGGVSKSIGEPVVYWVKAKQVCESHRRAAGAYITQDHRARKK